MKNFLNFKLAFTKFATDLLITQTQIQVYPNPNTSIYKIENPKPLFVDMSRLNRKIMQNKEITDKGIIELG